MSPACHAPQLTCSDSERAVSLGGDFWAPFGATLPIGPPPIRNLLVWTLRAIMKPLGASGLPGR